MKPSQRRPVGNAHYSIREASVRHAEPGFRYASFILLSDNVASPDSLIYDGPSLTLEKNKKKLCATQTEVQGCIIHSLIQRELKYV